MNSMQFVQQTSGGSARDTMPAQLSKPHVAKAGVSKGGEPLLSQLLAIWRRRKWLILGCVGGAVLLGLVLTLLVTPKYTASTTIEIHREGSNAISVSNNDTKTNFVDQEFYQTQYGLLQAQSLAERVATDLRLYDNQEFLERSGVKLDKFSDDGRAKQPAAWRAERVRAAGAALLKSFSVSPVRRVFIFNIRFFQ